SSLTGTAKSEGIRMTTPLKIGLAAACLVVVAILIAVDQSGLRKEDPIPQTSSGIPQAVLLPPISVAPQQAQEAMICPAVPTHAPETADKKATVSRNAGVETGEKA